MYCASRVQSTYESADDYPLADCLLSVTVIGIFYGYFRNVDFDIKMCSLNVGT